MANREDQLSFGDIASTLLGNAATGAASGASIAGPFGAIGGGIIGLGVGGISLKQQQEELEEAIAQQAALDADLDAVNNMAMIQQHLSAGFGGREQEAMAKAQAMGAQMNLTPAGMAELQRQMLGDVQGAKAQATAGAAPAAAQADIAEQRSIIDEYMAAQGLADNAFSGSSATQEAFGALAGATAALGQSGAFDEFAGSFQDDAAQQLRTATPQTDFESIVSPPELSMEAQRRATAEGIGIPQLGEDDFNMGALYEQQMAAQRGQYFGQFTFDELTPEQLDMMALDLGAGF